MGRASFWLEPGPWCLGRVEVSLVCLGVHAFAQPDGSMIDSGAAETPGGPRLSTPGPTNPRPDPEEGCLLNGAKITSMSVFLSSVNGGPRGARARGRAT